MHTTQILATHFPVLHFYWLLIASNRGICCCYCISVRPSVCHSLWSVSRQENGSYEWWHLGRPTLWYKGFSAPKQRHFPTTLRRTLDFAVFCRIFATSKSSGIAVHSAFDKFTKRIDVKIFFTFFSFNENAYCTALYFGNAFSIFSKTKICVT